MNQLPAQPFTLRDLEALGLSRNVLRRLIADGAVRRVLRGVFVRSDVSDTLELRAAAVSRVMPAHTVVCDRCAAWLHGIDCFEPDEESATVPLEVVSVADHDRSRRPELYGGKRGLRPEDICVVSGVKVTTPLRTAADLARLRGRRAALAVLDAFARQHDVSPADHVRMIRRLAGHRGVIQYRELAPLADPRPESFAESWTRMDIKDHGLPPPEPQVWVALPGFGNVRLDFGYPRWKVAVEYNGEEFHSSDAARAADQARIEALERAGWIVIVVTKADFRRGSSGQWLVALASALSERRTPRRRVYSRGEVRTGRR